MFHELTRISRIISKLAFTYSMLTTETLKQGVKYVKCVHWRRSGVFIVNFERRFGVVIVSFEHILHLVPLFLLLTLNM